jgi:hypothetical protein
MKIFCQNALIFYNWTKKSDEIRGAAESIGVVWTIEIPDGI